MSPLDHFSLKMIRVRGNAVTVKKERYLPVLKQFLRGLEERVDHDEDE